MNPYQNNIEKETDEYIKYYFSVEIPNGFFKVLETFNKIEIEKIIESIDCDPEKTVYGFYILYYKERII